MSSIFTLSNRLVVLNFGEVLADGKPEVIKNDPRVIEAYLGEDEDD
jgi:branched-chain amino acid transport system ATP-binding protein